jgi:hypothetical protein
MTLIVGERYVLKLDYDTECHGSIVLGRVYDKLEPNKKMRHFNVWKKHHISPIIKAGQEFINYVFVDTDDGEVCHFNVPKELDDYMIKNELYYEDILKPIKEFYGSRDNNNGTKGDAGDKGNEMPKQGMLW